MSTSENEFVKCAETLGWERPTSNLIITPLGTLSLLGTSSPNEGEFKILQQLLMLAVLEKKGWGIIKIDTEAGDEWRLIDACRRTLFQCKFSELPLAVVRAFNEERESSCQ